MKKDTPLGSRIAEVHNGSSIFTGDAGSGESNARRYMIENDLVEAKLFIVEDHADFAFLHFEENAENFLADVWGQLAVFLAHIQLKLRPLMIGRRSQRRQS